MANESICYRCQRYLRLATLSQCSLSVQFARWKHQDAFHGVPAMDMLELIDANKKRRRWTLAKAKKPIGQFEDDHLIDLFQSHDGKLESSSPEIHLGQDTDRDKPSELVESKTQPATASRRSRKLRGVYTSHRMVNMIMHQLRLSQVRELWDRFQASLKQDEAPGSKYSDPVYPQIGRIKKFDANIFETFIRRFSISNDFDYMSRSGKSLVASKIFIAQNTWATILSGVARSREFEFHEQLWKQMEARGMHGSEEMWVQRMQLLVRFGQWRSAIAALATFVNPPPEYGEAVKTVQPIRLVNIVLRELIRRGNYYDVREVFSWAEAAGIKANTATINQFIHAALREDRFDEALKGLDLLSQRSLSRDSATESMFLNAIVRNTRFDPDLSPSEQQDYVTAIFKEFNNIGFEINKFTYSFIISSLLNRGAHIAAADIVLDHMNRHGVEPSLELCTSLAGFYFKQDPVDYLRLDELVESMRLHNQKPDPEFCDRMIRGYALDGRIGKMMGSLADAEQRGFFPRWDVLVEVMDALARGNEHDLITQLIADARAEKGIFRKNRLQGKQSVARQFWERVRFWENKGLG